MQLNGGNKGGIQGITIRGSVTPLSVLVLLSLAHGCMADSFDKCWGGHGDHPHPTKNHPCPPNSIETPDFSSCRKRYTGGVNSECRWDQHCSSAWCHYDSLKEIGHCKPRRGQNKPVPLNLAPHLSGNDSVARGLTVGANMGCMPELKPIKGVDHDTGLPITQCLKLSYFDESLKVKKYRNAIGAGILCKPWLAYKQLPGKDRGDCVMPTMDNNCTCTGGKDWCGIVTTVDSSGAAHHKCALTSRRCEHIYIKYLTIFHGMSKMDENEYPQYPVTLETWNPVLYLDQRLASKVLTQWKTCQMSTGDRFAKWPEHWGMTPAGMVFFLLFMFFFFTSLALTMFAYREYKEVQYQDYTLMSSAEGYHRSRPPSGGPMNGAYQPPSNEGTRDDSGDRGPAAQTQLFAPAAQPSGNPINTSIPTPAGQSMVDPHSPPQPPLPAASAEVEMEPTSEDPFEGAVEDKPPAMLAAQQPSQEEEDADRRLF